MESDSTEPQGSAEDGNGAADARSMALASMSKAMEYLDNDPGISPIIGSHLQLAIDRLWASMAGGQGPVEL